MIKYTNEIDTFWELEELCWSGAEYTLNIIKENDMEDEFMDYLSDIFYGDDDATLTSINDFIWFESDMIFEHLGISEEEEEDEEEEE